ncbi:transcriptional regulator [Vibrio inusitatus NBRC 102082]|uniref:Transcriptional regulator n=1 Tax=Vibrio inusitatus NBRC 102082 TaxID=1219070 RepID=A0A4Y3HR55_9VIBR|nr:RodZ domain-containing protein [Vibrio inusitatus]GEA49222.1 transcriptional regulator [Vibrio inusitatus NBRC 102082]
MSKESSNTDTQHLDSKEGHATSPMVGDILRAKRESLGIDQKEIADRLRLRVAIIQSIDSNDFQLGQVHTFTRGYIRSYARAVGADEKVLLELFDSSEFAKPTEDKMQSFSQQTKKTKHDNNIMKLTWGIFAIIVGISAVWWWQSEQNSDTVVSEPVEVNESVLEESYDPALDAQLLAEPQSPNREPLASTDNEAARNEAELGLEPTSTADAEETVDADAPQPVQLPEITETSMPSIAMSFKADCWIQVQDVNGKTLWTGVKTAGQQLKLEGQGPFKFVLGAPEVVSLSISGEPVDLSRYTAGKVARFTAE